MALIGLMQPLVELFDPLFGCRLFRRDLSREERKPRALIIEQFELPDTGRLDGADVRRLMRVNKVTIRELAKRMQITMKRIRQIREIGLRDKPTIRDWVQSITGEDPGEL